MHTEATLDLGKILLYMFLLAHAHYGCFGLRKNLALHVGKFFRRFDYFLMVSNCLQEDK